MVRKESEMTRLIPMLAVGALTLSLSGSGWTAEETQQDQRTEDPVVTPADLTEQEQEYLAALKKCEDLQDAAKQKCIDEVRKQHGRM
jgi:hypothetical protein